MPRTQQTTTAISNHALCSFVCTSLLHAIVSLRRGNLYAAERWLDDARRLAGSENALLF